MSNENTYINFLRYTSNGNREAQHKTLKHQVTCERLGRVYQIKPESFYLSFTNDENQCETLQPKSDGSFKNLWSFNDYYVNGSSVSQNPSRNPSEAFASNFQNFRSTFGPSKNQINNAKNGSLTRINTVLPTASQNQSKPVNSNTKQFLMLKLSEDGHDWIEYVTGITDPRLLLVLPAARNGC